MTNDLDGADPTKALSRSAFALHANTVVTSALGFGFLLLAARLYGDNTAGMGEDLALVSAMMLLASLSELNLGLALPKLLPQMGRRSPQLIVYSYIVSSAVAFVFAFGFVMIAPKVAGSLEFLGHGVLLGIAFCVAVVIWNIFAVQDAVLVALRRALWVPAENGIFGIAKIGLLIALCVASVDHYVFYAWVIPMAIMVVPITWLLFARALPDHMRTKPNDELELHDPRVRRQVYRYFGLDYVASLFVQAATTVLPIVIVVILGAEANASFGIAFTIVTAVEQLALNVGISLTVEGSFDKRVLAKLVRHSLFRFGAMFIPLVVLMIMCAPLILWFFGPQYVSDATTVLRLLLLGTIPLSILVIYQALERVRGNGGRILAISAARTVVTLVAVIALTEQFGLAGAGWGWLIANAVLALFVLPSLVRACVANESAR